MKIVNGVCYFVIAVSVAVGVYYRIEAHLLEKAIERGITIDRNADDRDRRGTPIQSRDLSRLRESVSGARREGGGYAWVQRETNEELRERRMRLVAGMERSDGEWRVYANQIRIRLRYQELYWQLGLSPAEIERFEIAAAAEYTAINVFGLRLGQYPPDREARHLESAARNLDRIVRATLGKSAVQAFRDHTATGDLRSEIGNLAASTLYSGHPLSGEQGSRLLLLGLDHYAGDVGAVRLDPRLVDWAAVEHEAAQFLSPEQLQVLKRQRTIKAFDEKFKEITGLPYRRPIRGL